MTSFSALIPLSSQECKSNQKKRSLFSSDPTIITGMQKQSEKAKLKRNQNLSL